MKEIVLDFKGYWTEESERFIPDQSGIYCVYRAAHDRLNRKLLIKQLIYIGESERVRSRVSRHEAKSEWQAHLKGDEILCFSFTPILYDRNRVEAALIYHHQPLENQTYLREYPFPDTALFVTGAKILLSDCFAALESSDQEDWGA